MAAKLAFAQRACSLKHREVQACISIVFAPVRTVSRLNGTH